VSSEPENPFVVPESGDDSYAERNESTSPTADPADDAGAQQQERPTPKSEKTLWVGRTDWKHDGGKIVLLAGPTFVGLVLVAVWGPQYLKIAIPIALVVLGIVAAKVAIRVLGTRYRLTSERLFVERGIVRQTIDQIELIRVDDLRVRKLLVDRFFGLGSIDILSTDFTDAAIEIRGVADPDRVSELLRTQMRTARRKSVFIENL